MPPHQSFRHGERLSIEGGQSPREGVDEHVEFLVGDRTVDPSIALGGGSVVIIAARDDLKGARDPNQAGETLDAAASRHDPDAHLRLSQQGFFEAGEPQVASHASDLRYGSVA